MSIKGRLLMILLGALTFVTEAASQQDAPDLGQIVPSVYLIENGAAVGMTHKYIKGADVDGMAKVTLLGYVKRPGVYLFKDRITLLELLDAAGTVTLHDGSRSMKLVTVLDKGKSTVYDIERVRERKGPLAIYLQGDELIYREGLLGPY
jgi:hypothetical protein